MKINSSQLLGKLKDWCPQSTLFHCVLWAAEMDGNCNSYIRKWLGLPRCFSDADLISKNMLQLPLKYISL